MCRRQHFYVCNLASEVHSFPSPKTYPVIKPMCRAPTAQLRVPQRRGPKALQRKGAKLARARHCLELRASSTLFRMLRHLLCREKPPLKYLLLGCSGLRVFLFYGMPFHAGKNTGVNDGVLFLGCCRSHPGQPTFIGSEGSTKAQGTFCRRVRHDTYTKIMYSSSESVSVSVGGEV